MLSGKSILHVNQDVGKCYSFDSIKGYYNDLTEKVLLDKKNYDSTSVIKAEDGVNKKPYYFSIAIFQYGLASYDLFLSTGDKLMEAKFTSHLKWAYENQNKDGSWDTFNQINKDSPYSSMAQGEGASLLIRGYIHTKNKCYLDAAYKAIHFMITPVSSGGTALCVNDDIYFLEFTYLPCVFNGWIFSIFGLMDYCILTKNNEYLSILAKTLNTLEKNLQRMDCGYWSKYDLGKRISSPFYHKLHIAQLKVLYKYTNKTIYRDYYEKFEKYQSKKSFRNKALRKKAFQKVFSR